MATVSENLIALQNAKVAIKNAITAKGQDLTDVPFTEYANKIDAISVGNPVPLTVTENGVYENEQGFSPVTVDIKNKIPTDTTATAGDITEGKTAYVNGEKVVGTNTDAEFIRGFTTRTNMASMFGSCTSLVTIPLIDTSKVTVMENMFSGCTSLITIPLIDTSKVTSMRYMFAVCESLESIPELDTSNVINMANMFESRHYALKTIPKLNTSKVENMGFMFSNNGSIEAVPELDMRSVTNTSYMFNNTTKLTSCFVRNIKTSLQVGSGSRYGHLLTVESLIHLIYELRDTGNPLLLTIGNVNLNKLANVYVRLVDITDEMRAEDDLIDEKLPFEVCESTDEGAIQIVEYAKLKNWNIG